MFGRATISLGIGPHSSSVIKTPAFGGPIGTKIGDLVQYMTVGQLSFPLVSSVAALFYERRILHSASLLRLSVRPSICPSVGLS